MKHGLARKSTSYNSIVFLFRLSEIRGFDWKRSYKGLLRGNNISCKSVKLIHKTQILPLRPWFMSARYYWHVDASKLGKHCHWPEQKLFVNTGQASKLDGLMLDFFPGASPAGQLSCLKTPVCWWLVRGYDDQWNGNPREIQTNNDRFRIFKRCPVVGYIWLRIFCSLHSHDCPINHLPWYPHSVAGFPQLCIYIYIYIIIHNYICIYLYIL